MVSYTTRGVELVKAGAASRGVAAVAAGRYSRAWDAVVCEREAGPVADDDGDDAVRREPMLASAFEGRLRGVDEMKNEMVEARTRVQDG